jgi:hypothetical protein
MLKMILNAIKGKLLSEKMLFEKYISFYYRCFKS